MARPLFTGNYGSSLGNYSTAGQLLAARGQALGQAFQSIGSDIAGALEKHEQQKEKKRKEEGVALMAKNFIKSDPDTAKKLFNIDASDDSQVDVVSKAIGKNPESLNYMAGLQQMQLSRQQMQLSQAQENRAAARHTPEQAEREARAAAAIRENAFSEKFKKQIESLRKQGLESQANQLATTLEEFRLGGGAEGVAKQVIADKDLVRRGKQLSYEKTRQDLANQQKREAIQDVTAIILSGQEPSPVYDPNIVSLAQAEAKLINQRYDKVAKEIENIDSLIGYRTETSKAQMLTAISKMGGAEKQMVDSLRQELEDIGNEQFMYEYKGKRRTTTLTKIQADVDDKKLPPELLKNERVQTQLGRWESTRMKLDQIVQEQDAVFEDGQEEVENMEPTDIINKSSSDSGVWGAAGFGSGIYYPG